MPTDVSQGNAIAGGYLLRKRSHALSHQSDNPALQSLSDSELIELIKKDGQRSLGCLIYPVSPAPRFKVYVNAAVH